MFYSHLYGIESRAKSYIFILRCVLLAPLWNWKNTIEALNFIHVLFYSHLYGIESWQSLGCIAAAKSVLLAPLWNWKTTTARSTELLVHVLLAPLWNWKHLPLTPMRTLLPFYSHLYGIESRVPGLGYMLAGPFYSHLYGIESRCSQELSECAHCFTRTFMELKETKRRLVQMEITRFTRTFMELKEEREKWDKFSVSVLLAPLWNWK